MSLRLVLAASLLAIALSAHAAPAAFPDEVRIDSGALKGVSTDGVLAFKGVPFAAPPVGSRRWRAPQPVEAWTGVRSAASYGHDCMQTPFPGDAAPTTGTPWPGTSTSASHACIARSDAAQSAA